MSNTLGERAQKHSLARKMCMNSPQCTGKQHQLKAASQAFLEVAFVVLLAQTLGMDLCTKRMEASKRPDLRTRMVLELELGNFISLKPALATKHPEMAESHQVGCWRPTTGRI